MRPEGQKDQGSFLEEAEPLDMGVGSNVRGAVKAVSKMPCWASSCVHAEEGVSFLRAWRTKESWKDKPLVPLDVV